ncbi:MAG: hypothetical protein IJ130_07720 [Solobacterium sp.]|nr:hypothetical protein [Solobacterium sp.]
MSEGMIYMIYLAIPVAAILAIILVTAHYRLKDEGSVISEVFGIFSSVWENKEAESEKENASFYQMFLRLFKKAYEYEGFQVSMNKNKYFLYKTMVLLVIASVPFLMLFLVTKKDMILGDSEWNDIYLYTIIIVPLVLAYLLNKYIYVKQYRNMWIKHEKIRTHMEWRMMDLIKCYEMQKAGKTPEELRQLLGTLKNDFIDDICGYWNTSSEGYYDSILSKDENLFQEIGSLFGGK